MRANEQHLIDMHGDHFRTLVHSEEIYSSGDTHHSRLMIRDAQLGDAGKYVCFAATNQGYSYRSAFLNVNNIEKNHSNVQNAPESNSSTRDLVLKSYSINDTFQGTTTLPSAVIWLFSLSLAFIAFVVVIICVYGYETSQQLENGQIGRCPASAMAQAQISHVLQSTSTSCDQDMFSKWISEQNDTAYSLENPVLIRSKLAAFRYHLGGTSSLINHNEKLDRMATLTSASASDFFGSTARPNTPATGAASSCYKACCTMGSVENV